MKTASYIFLTAAVFASVNCSPATKTTTENVNINAQVGSNSAAENQAVNQTVTPETQREKDAIAALVADLYKQHDARKSPFFQTKNRALVDKYFEKNLADLIWKDANDSAGEVGALGFDPLYNAQDTNIRNFSVAAPKINGDKATVAASFENFKENQTVNYSLARENSNWKISDINYGGGSTLLGVFKTYAAFLNDVKVTSGEFEGTYRVGDTTCTVKPVKMAFEVKWKEGKGTEMFFADERDGGEKITFSSEAKKGQPNVFSFNDENYNIGTFYRADGKEFPIKRIK